MSYSFEHLVIACLSLYVLVREAVYLYSLQRLLNRIMSKNYHEFKYIEQNSLKNKFVPPKIDEGIPEDFGSMTGIG